MKAQRMKVTLLALLFGFLSTHALEAQQATSGDEVTVQRVWVGAQPDFVMAHPSPDGRYVTNGHNESGDLALTDLISGDVMRLGLKNGGYEKTWAEYSLFSPDGSTIAFVWYTGAGYSIKTIPLTGGEPRELVPAGVFGYTVLDDWSAEGDYLLVRMWNPEGEFCLCLIGTSDGSITPIPGTSELGEEVFSQRNAFSPDGKHVAFDTSVNPDDRDVFIVDVASGRATPVLEGQANDRLLGWFPDGSGLLFQSDRGATSGLWMLPLDSNLTPGEARLLRSDVWRAEPLGFSRDAFYYGVTVGSPQVYTGAIDARHGGYLAPIGPVQEAMDGNSFNAEFSPDGRYVAYARNRGAGKHDIVVRAVGGDDVRIFESDYQRSPIGWTPDSRAVLLNAFVGEGRGFGAERLDMATGESTVLDIAANPGRAGLVSPDGRWVYQNGRREIVALSLEDGSQRSIAQTKTLGSLSLSPDGSSFAVLDVEADQVSYNARIYTLPIGGGDPNVIFEIEGDLTEFDLGGSSGVPWTADGKHVLFILGDSIMRVSVDGGAAEKVVDLPEGELRHFRLHPDGSRFVVNAGVDKGEIWIVKGLPGMPGASDVSDN
jgi:Tol biopolymer transport system component